MTMIKHTGYNNKTKRKVVVIFREIPEERESALVVETESLMDRFHDGLMSATESAEGQATDNLYEVLNRRMFFDGEPMLQTLHSKVGYIRLTLVISHYHQNQIKKFH